MKIVRVEPSVPAVTMTWMIGSRCNYACSYCPDELHDDHSPHPDLEKLKLAWQNFHAKTQHIGLPYKISFTGGEVTANRSFLPLIEYLKLENFKVDQIFITTNGSASLNYYKRLSKLVNGISFSTHSEFIEEQDFFNKVEAIDQLMVRPERSVHVNIMNEFWNQDRINLYTKRLSAMNISHSVNEIDYSKQTRAEPTMSGIYNLEQV